TGQSKNSRCKGAGARRRKEKSVECICANREVSTTVSSGNRILTDGLPGHRINKREVTGIHRCSGARRPAGTKRALVASLEGPEQPVETELFQIVLRDFDKFRFNLDLLWNCKIQLLNNGIDKIQIVLRITNDQTAALRKKICAGARRK